MKAMRKLLFFLLFLPFLQGCIGCLIPSLGRRDMSFMKLSVDDRVSSTKIKSGVYYSIARDETGEVCDYSFLYILADHSASDLCSGVVPRCTSSPRYDLRIYTDPIHRDTTLSIEAKIKNEIIARIRMEDLGSGLNFYECHGNWRVSGDTLDIRTLNNTRECIRKVLSVKYKILNDTTLKPLFLETKFGRKFIYTTQALYFHMELPSEISPPTYYDFWD
jgi:hypothetical protein